MWAFIAHPRTTDKDPLQARIQKIFRGGGVSVPRILNFNKQKSQKGEGGVVGCYKHCVAWIFFFCISLFI